MQTKTVEQMAEESPWKKTEVSTPQNEYAKKITMAFAEYLADNNYEVDVRKGAAIFNEIDDPELHGEDGPELLTTHQVFLKFADANPELFIAGYRSQPTGLLPIETAPKDGTLLLLGEFVNDGGKYVLAMWDKFYLFGNKRNECWFGLATRTPITFIPTHWMPLPSAPASEPLPGELPGVEECMEMAHIKFNNLKPADCKKMRAIITFCQTPKQGKKD